MLRYIWLFPAFSVLLMLVACEKEADITTTDDSVVPNLSVTGSVDTRILLDMVNEKRLQGCTCGRTAMPPVAALEWDADLERIAYDHSLDMDAHQTMSHTGSDGSTARGRLDDANYTWQSYGENVAWNYQSEEAVIKGWFDSEGHCRNMMSANKEYLGVAQKNWYWTMLLTSK